MLFCCDYAEAEQTKWGDDVSCSEIITEILLSSSNQTAEKKNEVIEKIIIKLLEKEANIAFVFQTVCKKLHDILSNKYQQELEKLQAATDNNDLAVALTATFKAHKKTFDTMLRRFAIVASTVINRMDVSQTSCY